MLDQLQRIAEESRGAWLDTAAGLSAAAAALQATMRAAAEAMDASLQSALARLPAPEAGEVEAGRFAELQAALERLTAAIEHVEASPESSGNEATSPEGVGALGRGESIAASAVALVDRVDVGAGEALAGERA